MLSAIVEARARGVRVDVLMTRKARKARRHLCLLEQQLAGHGVHVVRSPLHGRYHAKFIVADRRLALVSSANFTLRCFTRTSDYLLVTTDPAVVDGLTQLFDADSGLIDAAVPAGERLIVGPEQARIAFARLIRAAGHSIRIADRKLTDPAMRALLLERRAAGVDVRVLDRRTVGSQIAHGKLCILDGRTAIVGSLALASRSLDRGRELSIRVDQPELVARLTGHFDAACTWAVRLEERCVA